MVLAEALATLEWLRMLMCARTTHAAGAPISSLALALPTVVVTKETAISQWIRLNVAETAVHLAGSAIFRDCSAIYWRLVDSVDHVPCTETAAVPKRRSLQVEGRSRQTAAASVQCDALTLALCLAFRIRD